MLARRAPRSRQRLAPVPIGSVGPAELRPYIGSPQTVAKLIEYARESQKHLVVRQLAEGICQGIDSKDYLSEYLAIYRFVEARTRYMRDPVAVELVRKPWLLAAELIAGWRSSLDCDDVAGLIAALVMAVGGRVRFVRVAFQNAFYRGERQYSHIFVQAYEPKSGRWITLDPVAAERTKDMISKVKAAAINAV